MFALAVGFCISGSNDLPEYQYIETDICQGGTGEAHVIFIVYLTGGTCMQYFQTWIIISYYPWSSGGYYLRWMAMDVYIISDSQSFKESTASDQATPHDPSLSTTRPPVSHGAKGSQTTVTTLPSVLLVVLALIALSA